ncbi:hypothetical protein [uncultured Tateyamaria sp.]|uniref:hypothetical protein n=1 Tax=uncultured Tateyamaria sp. TaxID=455651 RepID=UPI002632E5A8|nr:hypothetical protein [uncultured Tateyamaria sp.]
MNRYTNSVIPIWVNLLQIVLTLIMLGQVYMYFFDHQLLAATGVPVEGVPMLNLIFEMGGRTATMAAASIFVLITQDPRQYLIVLAMNIFREGAETVIDPLFPIANAPAGPMTDFSVHLVIVAIEILAFIAVWKTVKADNTPLDASTKENA